MYFVYFCMTWMPSYFVERRHLSLKSMGAYTAFSFAGMAAVSALAGWAADRIIARGGDPVGVRKAFTIAGFLIASAEVIGALSDSIPVALFFGVDAAGCVGAGLGADGDQGQAGKRASVGLRSHLCAGSAARALHSPDRPGDRVPRRLPV